VNVKKKRKIEQILKEEKNTTIPRQEKGTEQVRTGAKYC